MFNIGSNKSYKKVKEDNCVVVYEVNVDEKTTGEMENNATLKLQSVVSLPGFRVGKVPPGMIKQQFPSMVKDEVLDLAAKSAVNEIIENEKTYPVVAPVIGKINYEPSRKISFELKLEVNSRFEPKKYEKIQVTRKTHKVSEEDIDKRLKLIREYNAYLKSVDENAVVAGNHYVIVDYEIYENGVKSENGDFKGEIIDMSSPQTIAGMSDAVLGAKKGEEKEFETEFDGKKMKFKVKINEIKEKIVPEIDENFLKQSGAKSMEELGTQVRKLLELQETEKTEKDVIRQIEDSLIKDNRIPLPPTVVNEEIKELFEIFKKKSNAENPETLSLENYLNTLRPVAERNLTITYLLHNIAKKENINAGDEDLSKELDKVIRALKSEDEIKKAREIFETRKDYIMASIVENKTFEFIKSKAEMKEQAA